MSDSEGATIGRYCNSHFVFNLRDSHYSSYGACIHLYSRNSKEVFGMKASESERRDLKPFVEDYFNVKLTVEPGYRKWFKDKKGRNWWLLVSGDDLFCGISEKMMEGERNANTKDKGMFVLGVWKKTCIDVYASTLDQLVEFSYKLSTDKDGKQYKLNFDRKVYHLALKGQKIPTFMPAFIDRIPHDRDEETSRHNFEELLNNISHKGERYRIIKSLMERLK